MLLIAQSFTELSRAQLAMRNLQMGPRARGPFRLVLPRFNILLSAVAVEAVAPHRHRLMETSVVEVVAQVELSPLQLFQFHQPVL